MKLNKKIIESLKKILSKTLQDVQSFLKIFFFTFVESFQVFKEQETTIKTYLNNI